MCACACAHTPLRTSWDPLPLLHRAPSAELRWCSRSLMTEQGPQGAFHLAPHPLSLPTCDAKEITSLKQINRKEQGGKGHGSEDPMTKPHTAAHPSAAPRPGTSGAAKGAHVLELMEGQEGREGPTEEERERREGGREGRQDRGRQRTPHKPLTSTALTSREQSRRGDQAGRGASFEPSVRGKPFVLHTHHRRN